jgi:phosphinothricin acetyltransferase
MATIRHADPADAREIAEIYRPAVEATAISFELEAPDEREMRRRIAKTSVRAPWLVCTRDQVVVGYVYASLHHERAAYVWSVDVTAYVRVDQRRRGIARALYTSLFALLRLQGYYAAHAGITLPNAASVALHETMGFRPVGVYPAVGFKMGAWNDVGWWQLALRDRVGTPAPPCSVSDLQRTGEWEAALAAGASLVRE